jgi:hypothetical protein
VSLLGGHSADRSVTVENAGLFAEEYRVLFGLYRDGRFRTSAAYNKLAYERLQHIFAQLTLFNHKLPHRFTKPELSLLKMAPELSAFWPTLEADFMATEAAALARVSLHPVQIPCIVGS